jgi:hypothetical protein
MYWVIEESHSHPRSSRDIVPGTRGDHPMDDSEPFAKLLGITTPWRITRATVNAPAECIDF